MLGRLGFTGRILATLLLGVLVFSSIAATATYIGNRNGFSSDRRLLLPQQSAAIVKLLDASDVQLHPQVLKAVASDTLAVTTSATRPQMGAAFNRQTGIEWLISQQFDASEKRDILVQFPNAKERRFPRIYRLFRYFSESDPLQISISLRSGSYAVIEARGALVPRIFGLPTGFGIGVLGALVGLAAIWAIAREARPLKRLVASVDRFAENAVPAPVVPAGAPEIQRLIRTSNEMQQRIAGLVAGRRLFLGAISHDLKTFLTRIRLRIEDLPEEGQRIKLAGDLDDMTRLLDDALAMASNRDVSVRHEIVDLRALLLEELSDRPREKVFLAAQPDDGEFKTKGDQLALRRLFGNLVNNALTFGTRCVVALRQSETDNVILIEDDGPGISPADHHRVFEPFFRADASRSRQTGGNGLGLAIAKQIAENHGGTIAIGAAAMGGAQLKVSLPRAS